MICRRCGHEHVETACPLCGQPRPDQIATPEQRRVYRQRLHVTAVLPREVAQRQERLLALASYRCASDKRVWATFREDNLPPFLQLWEAIAEEPHCELLFNGQRRPYDRELWIPLLWLAADPSPRAAG
jgi:hypothetical protein